jgi:hypothetical protein
VQQQHRTAGTDARDADDLAVVGGERLEAHLALRLAPGRRLDANRLRDGRQVEAHGHLDAAALDREPGALEEAQHADVAGRAEGMQAREALAPCVLDHRRQQACADPAPAQRRVHRERDLAHRRFLRCRAHLADAGESARRVVNGEHHVAAEVDAIDVATQPGIVELAAEAQATRCGVEPRKVGADRIAIRLADRAYRCESLRSVVPREGRGAFRPRAACTCARVRQSRAHWNLGVICRRSRRERSIHPSPRARAGASSRRRAAPSEALTMAVPGRSSTNDSPATSEMSRVSCVCVIHAAPEVQETRVPMASLSMSGAPGAMATSAQVSEIIFIAVSLSKGWGRRSGAVRPSHARRRARAGP